MRALALALIACAGPAIAQVPCPHASEVTAAHLFGLWRAEFSGQGHAGTLLLEKHALYAESVSGTINRNGDRSKLAGDVEDGEFTLEESADGVHIAATWLGEVVEGSCGREIRGSWKAERDAQARDFVLRKD
ncbi:hypothetical protein [Ramlibacter alkalitolerans]|jgi:hypothetical protein|uniref:DUF2147 domain-containing protein n=1 Tax=Ramlibacter alkalitolerans TaxID=2039631 RepID=A0ABS1JWF1_9BURK|nr:hypothetical protein [Ramlibacter alkalitolerans]MBL0428644.1 hypothetical protein [Ramlibacter alkalitolerans]